MSIEQRQYPRVQIPLLVEISHPALGTLEAIAKDASEGGLFVRLENTGLQVGNQLKVRVLNLLPSDLQNNPTVAMEVRHVATDGLGLAFRSRTAEHLWQSVQRLRNDLEIGRDYFQVHHSLAVRHPEKGILVVQQYGKWLLPGYYLMVGDEPANSVTVFLDQQFGLQSQSVGTPFAIDSLIHSAVTEAAVYHVFLTLEVVQHSVSLPTSSAYKDWRWLGKAREVRDLTFASQRHRDLVTTLMEQTGNV